MPDKTSFTAHGDEPVEARIVSWVLGEASAFEAAELERLCEKQPELMVFKRRMMAMHGMLKEAEQGSGDDWKLPTAKREPIELLIGKESDKANLVRREKQIRKTQVRALLAIAACVALTLVVMDMFLLPVMHKEAPIIVTYSAEMGEANEMSEMRFALDAQSDQFEPERKPMRPSAMQSVPMSAAPPQSMVKRDAKSKAPTNEIKLSEAAKKGTLEAEAKGDHFYGSKEGSSRPRAITSGIPSTTAVPMPEITVEAPSVDFGESKDFGIGWGSADEQLAQKANAMPSAGADAFSSRDGNAPQENTGGGGAGGFESDPFAAGPSDSLAKLNDESIGGQRMGREKARYDDYKGQGGKAAIAPDLANNAPMKPGQGQGGEIGYEISGGYQSGHLFRGVDLKQAQEQVRRQLAEKELIEATQIEGDDFLGDAPVTGRLFADQEGKERGNRAMHLDQLKETEKQAKIESNLRNVDEALVEELALTARDKSKNGKGGTVDGKQQLGLLAEREMLRRQAPDSDEDQLVQNLTTAELSKAVSEQQELIEERKKVLEAIVQTKGSGDANGESIRRGLDVQDFVDAKQELELAQQKLEAMNSLLKRARITKSEKKPEVVIGDEIKAAEDPFSTFSLNVSDASFQIAQAAMARGEQPDPAGIKVEQFYNAVDYGDPAPVSGQPIAGVIEQAAHPVIPGRNLVRVSLKTAAAGRSASQPLRLTLLIDQSGSMVREDRRAAMNEALTSLSKLLTANDKVTVIGFSRTSHLLADGMSGEEAGKLKDLIHQEASEGGTNLEEAIKLAEQLALRHKLEEAQNRIVLLTDGAANLGDADPNRLAEKVVALRQQGIAFDIAGIAADELNDELLAELARNGNGRYYVVGKGANGDFAKKLAGAFRPAAENVKVQVRFNPERVSRYKLIGFKKDRLKTEDFRNDAVDAAEMAAEEAGVAIYQVETIADGRGELGEVSVRFRDAESRDMVERSWTLPFDAAAPAIDRASPSMQLATLSMLVGQKLKGDELANAIDFNDLTASQAEVKQTYGSDKRVMELLQMVDQLK